MKKPFVLFQIEKKHKHKKNTKKRIKMPMRYQTTQCEWLWEATASSPEQALGIAVIQRAVLDLITPGVDERDKDDAEKWLSGHKGEEFERNYAMSFSRIVEGFTEISVDEFRNKIFTFIQNAKLSKENADGFRFQRS